MSVAKQTALAVFEGLARLGIDAPGLGVTRLNEDEDLDQLWRRAIARARRRTVPLEVGLALPLGAMGAIDYLAASSATVGAALKTTQQAFALAGPGVQLTIGEPRGGVRRLTIVNQPPFPGQIESDAFVVGAILSRIRMLAGRPVDVPAVELTEPEPASAVPWLRLLDVPRVQFGARRARIHLRASAWTIAMRSADPRLLATLKAMVGVDHRSADGVLVASRSLAAQRLPVLLDLSEAAPALGMSRLTLQRKLAASGTSLSLIVDEARRDRAEELVSLGFLTLGEVAIRVG